MNGGNDDGENDKSIAQAPYLCLGYLKVSDENAHCTTLKPNKDLWRTLTQKVNTARITVRRMICGIASQTM